MPPTNPTPPENQPGTFPPQEPNQQAQPEVPVSSQQAPMYQSTPSPQQPAYSPPTPEQQPYEFIVNPSAPAKPTRLAGAPKIVRIGIVLGIILIIFVLFMVIKGLLSGGGNTQELIYVVQDQQEIIHLTTLADSEGSLSDSNSYFAATAKLSVATSQSALIKYMNINGHKITKKDLALAIDVQTDKDLKLAAAADTYNTKFHKVMQETLKNYQAELTAAYNKTSGKAGKALLKSDYQQAQILLDQLGA